MIVSKQYTMNTSFGFQPKNQTPITGKRFAAIKKISDCVSVRLNIFKKTWKLSVVKVTIFVTSPPTLRVQVRHLSSDPGHFPLGEARQATK